MEALRLNFAGRQERLWARNRGFYDQAHKFDVKLIKRRLMEIEKGHMQFMVD